MDIKVSEAWLRERFDPGCTTAELTDQLTQAGLTVERAEPVAPPFTGVCVALIEKVAPHHPQADKLSICQVHDGRFRYEVVCGAPNVKAQMKVAYAKSGAELPGGVSIKTREIRGQSSDGMLCSAAELGLGDAADAILALPDDAPLGEDLRAYLQLADHSLSIDLTPNRADCLSIEGLARELGAINGKPLPALDADADVDADAALARQKVPAKINDKLHIQLQDPEACPRYLGRIIKNVNLQAQTPIWMREKLRRCNIRPIDPVVDVTNYVLRELGQPMHAFDLDKLQGGIQVRRAKEGEELLLLNQKTVTLKPDTLVIADDKGALAMAGVMGGHPSSIRTKGSDCTKHIFLESAFFSPLAIAGQARSYGLVTDAAQCYERGVDFELPGKAIERATALLLDIVGGEPGPVVQAMDEAHLPERPEITLRLSRLNAVLGMTFASDRIAPLFESLGMQLCEPVTDSLPSLAAGAADSLPLAAGVADSLPLAAGASPSLAADSLPPSAADSLPSLATGVLDEVCYRVRPPSWRFDMHCEADLIEEVARLHGYNKLPAVLPDFTSHLQPLPVSAQVAKKRALCDQLVTLGYQETIHIAFSSLDDCRIFSPQATPIRLQNPAIADRPLMRTSLLPALIATLVYNQNRQQKPIKLFATGLVFEHDSSAENGIRQTPKVAGLIPQSQIESWHTSTSAKFFDFYDLKGDLEMLLGAKVTWTPLEHPAFHPGQSATISLPLAADSLPSSAAGALPPLAADSLPLAAGALPSSAAGALPPLAADSLPFSAAGALPLAAGALPPLAAGASGQSATIKLASQQLGLCGALHPGLHKQLNIKAPCYLFELDVNLFAAQPPISTAPISQHPSIRRDLAVIVEQSIAAGDVLKSARQAAGPLLVDIALFDLYEGKGLPSTSKSLAFGLTFQSPDRSLLESEVDEVIEAVLRRLQIDCQATLRN